MAYDENPRLDNYTAFALRIQGTVFQLGAATISCVYIEELCQGRHLSQNLLFSQSELYDLLECDRRREALRFMIGLIKSLT